MKRGINFEEYDVTKDEEARKKVEKISGGAVPVLDWGGKIIIGYGRNTPKMIDNLIRKHPHRTSRSPNNSVPVEAEEKEGSGVDVNSNSDPHLAPFRSKVESLETLFQDVQAYIVEKGIKTKTGERILKKCFEANLAKLVYEFCQSENFVGVVEKNSGIMPEQRAAVIAAAQRISFEKYRIIREEFREVCSQKPEITSKTRFILKKVIAQSEYNVSGDELFDIESILAQPQKQEEITAEHETKAVKILKTMLEPTKVETEK